MGERFAIYYAPEQGSELERFGEQWLGRCAEAGKECDRLSIPEISRDQLRTFTSTPRHYGFHGTVVPPFELREPHEVDIFFEHVGSFAKEHEPFRMEPFIIKEIGSFIALALNNQQPIADLAASCVRSFHPFRAEPSLAEMERRRAKGLTPAQQRNLTRWYYPYVMDDFLFHMTLTGSLSDSRLRKRLVRSLTALTESIRSEGQVVRELSLFHQPDREEPFRLVQRIPMGR